MLQALVLYVTHLQDKTICVFYIWHLIILYDAVQPTILLFFHFNILCWKEFSMFKKLILEDQVSIHDGYMFFNFSISRFMSYLFQYSLTVNVVFTCPMNGDLNLLTTVTELNPSWWQILCETKRISFLNSFNIL